MTTLFAVFQPSFMLFLVESFLYKYRHFKVAQNSEIIPLVDL